MGEPELKRMTPDEFLVWQESQDAKFELASGQAIQTRKSVAGATRSHDAVQVNVIGALSNQLRRSSWSVATDNIAVLVPNGDVRRPDLIVESREADLSATATADPKMVIEVLSPPTIDYDRFKKLEEYKTVPSLAYILLVDTEKPQLSLHLRKSDGWNVEHHATLDAVIDLPEINCRLAARDVFEGLPFAE